MADWGSSRSDNSTDLPTIIPQALTSPISFLSATPPPDSFSPAASLAEPDVLPRCLGPSVMLMARLGLPGFLVVFCLPFHPLLPVRLSHVELLRLLVRKTTFAALI